MRDLDKVEVAVTSPVYLAYSQLIGAAMARLVLGDLEAKQELLDLQKEQMQVVSEAMKP